VATGWWSAVLKDIAASEYGVIWQDPTTLPDVPAGWQAPNRAQNFRTYFTAEGIRVIPRSNADVKPAWEWGLTLVAYGRDGEMTKAGCGDFRTNGNRVEYDHHEIVEWYVNDAHGLEQGFTIANRPAAKSPNGRAEILRIELAVLGNTSAQVAENGAAVDFLAPGGARAIRFADLHVADANGAELPASFEVSGSQLAIVVDDYGAAYPLTIDPLATSPAWTAESDQAGAFFGYSVATAGDVNGDGYSDVIVGAHLYDNGQTDEGRAFVYHGSAAGLSATPNWTAESDQASAFFGYSVATAGDVNGDGYSDVIVGAYGYDNGQTSEGRAFVYYGSAAGPERDAELDGRKRSSERLFGYSVATAGTSTATATAT
jgi:hypothetical protein